MNIITVIPARGGSKGVPGKNIKLLGGKPLIYYTIEAAREIFSDEQIIISTDDEKIKQCVEKTGLRVPFLRPSELARDESGMHEVLIHALSFLKSQGSNPDILVLLQPTTPFRNSHHINEALELFDSDTDMVVSVKETKSNPYYSLFEENEMGWLKRSKNANFSRRQDCPKVYEYNGGIYIIKVESLLKSRLHEFEKIRKYVMNQFDSIDIDDSLDWIMAEMISKR